MFTRETILKNLNTENYYIDNHSLNLFLEDWKIESIYEDESGLEFYDNLALDKIKKGISLKAQGYSDEQIITKLSRMEAKVTNKEETDKPVQPIILKDITDNDNDSNAIEKFKTTEILSPKENNKEIGRAHVWTPVT